MKNAAASQFLTLQTLLQSLENADVPVTISDALAEDMPLVFVNQAFLNLTGYTEAEVIGKNCRFLQGHYQQANATYQIRQALEKGEVCNVDLVNYTKLGREFINRLHLCPIKNNGRVEYFLGFQKNISGHTLVLIETLFNANQDHKTLIDAMSEGVVIHDATGKIIECNLSAQRILGLTLDQMQGITSMDERWHAVHEDGSPFPGQDHPAMRVIRTGESVFGEIMGVYHASGELRWLSINATQLMHNYNSDEPGKVLAVFTDITLQKHTEWLADHDELSRLYNRRHFNHEMPKVIQQTQLYCAKRYFMMIDCDFFKGYNDSYGHNAGDEVIKLVGKMMLDQFKGEKDICFRVGGEEFAIYFEAPNKTNAFNQAENLRIAIADKIIPHKENRPWCVMTVSIGLYELPNSPTLSLMKVYDSADKALYFSKSNGRNQTNWYDETLA